jgi:hypothetical protein
MKIVNFKKYQPAKIRGKRKDITELAVFEIEFAMMDGSVLTWGGWSVRKLKEGNPFLQAPLIYHPSTNKLSPVLVLSKFPIPLFLKLLRHKIKDSYGIEIPDPKPLKVPKKSPPQ